MKFFLKLIVLLFYMLPSLAGAQDSSFQKKYAALFENPSASSSDYKAIRDAYTKEPTFNPGYDRYTADLNSMVANYQKGNFAESIKFAHKVLKADQCNTAAHSALGAAYKELGNKRLAELHNKFFNGLAASIIDSGEFGNSKKPFHVITQYEMHAIIDYLGMKLVTLVPVKEVENGSAAVWAKVTNQENQEGYLYFETNTIVNWGNQKK